MIHANSIKAWQGFPETSRIYMVMDAIVKAGRPLTDRDVCSRLGSADMNFARPTITRLVQEGLLAEVGSTICPVSGRTVRLIGLPTTNFPETLFG